MAQTSRPWDKDNGGDAGPYSHLEWSEIWRDRLGHQTNQGVLPFSNTDGFFGLECVANSPASMDVIVKPGAAIVQGIAYRSTADETLSISSNTSGNPRIDTIVLRADYASGTQSIRLAVLSGTPAASPVAPSLTKNSGVLWEIPLCDVAVANGVAQINQSDITPRAHRAGLPPAVILPVLNNHGSTIEDGECLKWDASVDWSVIPSSDADDTIAGVAVGDISTGSWGYMMVEGIHWVWTSGAVTRGDMLRSSTTSGRATQNGYNHFAIALETISSAGRVRAYIRGQLQGSPNPSVSNVNESADFTTTSTSFVDIHSTLQKTITTSGKAITVKFVGVFTGITGDRFALDIDVDGTRYGGTDGIVLDTMYNDKHVTMVVDITGLSAGSHTIKLQWKSVSGSSITMYAGAGTSGKDLPPQFSVMEIK